MIKVVISVVSHGQEALVERFLATIDKGRLESGRAKFRVVVTHNLPLAAGVDLRKFDLDISEIQNLAPRSFGRNHNTAFATSECDVFIVANPDVDYRYGSFVDLVAESLSRNLVLLPMIDEGSGAKGLGRLKPSFIDLSVRFFNLFILRKRASDVGVSSNNFDWLPGIFLVFPAEIFAELRGFDESLFMYYEDADLCRRASLAGYSLGIHDSVVMGHAVGRGSAKNLRLAAYHLINAVRVGLWRRWVS